MKAETSQWLAKAEADWATAGREAAVSVQPNHDAVCFHYQQCAEKYLKARLERWPETSRGERRFVLRRFPYSVLYRIRGSEVFIT